MVSYFFRVVSYIKNGWENNFIDKYKHLGADIPDTTAVAANLLRNTPEFPQVANWQPIINVRESFPSFTIEHMITYFIERVQQCDVLDV